MSLRQWFRQLEPRVLRMINSPVFVRIKPWVDQHDVFSFRREPLARGLAFGMFCSLIPGPLQMLASLLVCVMFRANVIAAFAATIVSNPITIVPLYVAAFHIGAVLLPGQAELVPISSVMSVSFGSTDWFMALSTWVQSLGWPLALGLPILGVLMAVFAYALVQVLWLWPIWVRLRKIKRKR